jgi:hypothetical protein
VVQLELFGLNFGKINILSKIIKYKRFSKIELFKSLMFATIRFNSVVDHVGHSTHPAFMQGGYILNGAVTLHEHFMSYIVERCMSSY